MQNTWFARIPKEINEHILSFTLPDVTLEPMQKIETPNNIKIRYPKIDVSDNMKSDFDSYMKQYSEESNSSLKKEKDPCNCSICMLQTLLRPLINNTAAPMEPVAPMEPTDPTVPFVPFVLDEPVMPNEPAIPGNINNIIVDMFRAIRNKRSRENTIPSSELNRVIHIKFNPHDMIIIIFNPFVASDTNLLFIKILLAELEGFYDQVGSPKNFYIKLINQIPIWKKDQYYFIGSLKTDNVYLIKKILMLLINYYSKILSIKFNSELDPERD
jgi:hypothetical protein